MDESVVRLHRAGSSPGGSAPVDPYVVRLSGGTASRPAAPPDRRDGPTSTPVRVRRRRWPRNLALAAVALAVLVWQQDAVERLAGGAVDVAKEPINRIEGQDHLRRATFAAGTLWGEHGTLDVTETRLEEVAPEVKWGETVVLRPCWGGQAAVLMARTATGDVSRLIIAGGEWGTVEGNHECPASRQNLTPWNDTSI